MQNFSSDTRQNMAIDQHQTRHITGGKQVLVIQAKNLDGHLFVFMLFWKTALATRQKNKNSTLENKEFYCLILFLY